MRVHRDYWEVERKTHWMGWQIDNSLPEWLVEMTAHMGKRHVIRDVVIVRAANDLDASRQAFATRNIPGNWVVTEIERG